MVDHDLAIKLRALVDCSGREVIWVIENMEILLKGERNFGCEINAASVLRSCG
jgi:hypothetical protein